MLLRNGRGAALPRLTDRIAWRRLGIAGHCYRHRELPASQLVLWEPTHGRRKPGRPATTFLNILQDDIGATTSAELPACMKDCKDWNLRREARLRPPWWWWWWWWWRNGRIFTNNLFNKKHPYCSIENNPKNTLSLKKTKKGTICVHLK